MPSSRNRRRRACHNRPRRADLRYACDDFRARRRASGVQELLPAGAGAGATVAPLSQSCDPGWVNFLNVTMLALRSLEEFSGFVAGIAIAF